MTRTRLKFEQLEGRDTPSCILANDAATPGGANTNPGTAQAVTAIPADVFAEQVRPQWFGRAASETACDHAHNAT
jgi:hypothetical protein